LLGGTAGPPDCGGIMVVGVVDAPGSRALGIPETGFWLPPVGFAIPGEGLGLPGVPSTPLGLPLPGPCGSLEQPHAPRREITAR